MQRRYLSRAHPGYVRNAWIAMSIFVPFSTFCIWALHGMFDEHLIFSSEWHHLQPPISIWEDVFITLLLLLPVLSVVLSVLTLVPGTFSVTLTDDAVRVRRLVGTRTVPREDVTFIGLRVQGAWLLAQLGLMVPPASYYLPDGRTLPVIRLVIEYRNRRRHWPGHLRRVRLPVFFSKEDINAMHRWATIGSLASA